MARKISNVPASIRARLQNVARRQRTDFQNILVRYALERLLFRLSLSPYKDLFILKGAMLYAAWPEAPHRMTRDLDLLSSNRQKIQQWQSFLAREALAEELDLEKVILDLAGFIMPVLDGVRDKERTPEDWHPETGWT